MYWPSYHVGSTGNMSTTDVRTPRPAKTPAWSVPPMMTSPMEDPSSCSDNASDNSDKLESYCQAPAQNTANKTRKRKIVSSSGAAGGFMNAGAMNGAMESGPPGRGGSAGEHGPHNKEMGGDARNAGKSNNFLYRESYLMCSCFILSTLHLFLVNCLQEVFGQMRKV